MNKSSQAQKSKYPLFGKNGWITRECFNWYYENIQGINFSRRFRIHKLVLYIVFNVSSRDIRHFVPDRVLVEMSKIMNFQDLARPGGYNDAKCDSGHFCPADSLSIAIWSKKNRTSFSWFFILIIPSLHFWICWKVASSQNTSKMIPVDPWCSLDAPKVLLGAPERQLEITLNQRRRKLDT